MNKQVKKALGGDSGLLKGFEWIPLPTTNFGLMTAFVYTTNKKPSFQNEWCASFSCLGVDPPSDLPNIIGMNGFADVGASAAVTLTEKEEKDIALNVLLPAIYNILSVGGGFNKNSVLDTRLKLGTVHVRVLNKGKALSYLKKIPMDSDNHQLLNSLNARTLGLVVADVMVESMSVTLELKTGTDANLNAALNNPAPGSGVLPKVFGATADKKPSLTVKAARGVVGKYQFEISQPVIVARLVGQYPIFSIADGGVKNVPNTKEQVSIIDSIKPSLKGLSEQWAMWTLGKNCTVPKKEFLCIVNN
ncbi:MAG: hypothetical protein IPL32_01045 [Chloracidobacterium sp.]|nr:hypothetical protein [Chloracidobacterium sp.]